MDILDSDKLRESIFSLVENKERASLVLAEHFGCYPGNLFYKYLKQEIVDQGIAGSGERFLFHGYGCSVSNDSSGWNVELEFGPRGEVCGFDKYTLCHNLGFSINDTEKVIDFLIEKKIIRLVDEQLYQLLKNNPENINWESEEQEMDACVADRYVLCAN